MALRYAPMCKSCGERKTSHPSGLCSRCRSKPIKRKNLCKGCGSVYTNAPDGICAQCRLTVKTEGNLNEHIDAAIEELKECIFILEQRKAKLSFGKIAEMLGKSKSTVYTTYKRALNLRNPVGGYDSVDGTYIPSEDEEEDDSIMDIIAYPRNRESSKDQ